MSRTDVERLVDDLEEWVRAHEHRHSEGWTASALQEYALSIRNTKAALLAQIAQLQQERDSLREENERLKAACSQFMGPTGCGGNGGEHHKNCHMRFSTYPPADCTCGVWLAKAAADGTLVEKFVLRSERDELKQERDSLRDRATGLERQYREEYAIVDTVWDALGLSTTQDRAIGQIVADLKQERDSLKVELDKLRDAAQSQPLKSSKLKDALKIKYHRSGGRSCVKHGDNVIVGEPPNEQCKVCDITEERDSANTIASDAKFQNERLVERVKAVEQERDSARAEVERLKTQLANVNRAETL